MKANSLILIALLTLAGFGAGMIIGGRLGSPRPPTAASPSTSPAVGTQADRLPAIKPRPKPTGPGKTETALEPASVVEIEAALQKAVRMSGSRSYKALNDLIQKINPADIPNCWPSSRSSPPPTTRPSCARCSWGAGRKPTSLPPWLTPTLSPASKTGSRVSSPSWARGRRRTPRPPPPGAANSGRPTPRSGPPNRQLRTCPKEPGGGLCADDRRQPGRPPLDHDA